MCIHPMNPPTAHPICPTIPFVSALPMPAATVAPNRRRVCRQQQKERLLGSEILRQHNQAPVDLYTFRGRLLLCVSLSCMHIPLFVQPRALLPQLSAAAQARCTTPLLFPAVQAFENPASS